MRRGQYNQIANYVVAQSEINIAIGSKEPGTYFSEIFEQCGGSGKKYGNITDPDGSRKNLRMNCIPEDVVQLMTTPPFLAEGRS